MWGDWKILQTSTPLCVGLPDCTTGLPQSQQDNFFWSVGRLIAYIARVSSTDTSDEERYWKHPHSEKKSKSGQQHRSKLETEDTHF